MSGFWEYVEAGGLMSYGTNWPDPVPARQRLCRQDFARGEAGRNSGRAADEVRSHHQSDDRQEQFEHFTKECINAAEQTEDHEYREMLLKWAMEWRVAAAQQRREASTR
jgi:hypothetical protein